jgi:hypothetical protein
MVKLNVYILGTMASIERELLKVVNQFYSAGVSAVGGRTLKLLV